MGMKDRTRYRPAVAQPTMRLVTPVAAATPTLDEAGATPVQPARPPRMLAQPLARMPPCRVTKSGRTQSASVSFWNVLMSAISLSTTASVAIR